ncbi:hypothetical protein [Microcoleus anatoxicus]|uniref:Uncharacterized protein n=1 Tax=Microcoleus anatoxicus PTRS2 TaxID=2705321 RepID=A0ABU8YH58_9CYAN
MVIAFGFITSWDFASRTNSETLAGRFFVVEWSAKANFCIAALAKHITVLDSPQN